MIRGKTPEDLWVEDLDKFLEELDVRENIVFIKLKLLGYKPSSLSILKFLLAN